jgi:hypothetical protein
LSAKKRATDITNYAKDTILLALQEFFSNGSNAGDSFLFNPSLDQSKILIADKYTTNLEEVEKKPAIVVMRGAQSWTRRGIGQHLGRVGPGHADTFKDMINGSFTCLCMSKVGPEAEEIGHMAFVLFQMFRKAIIKDTGVHDIQSVTLGEEIASVTDSKIDIAVVPVTLNLLITWDWKLEERGPVLREVNVDLRRKNAETLSRFLKRGVRIGA